MVATAAAAAAAATQTVAEFAAAATAPVLPNQTSPASLLSNALLMFSIMLRLAVEQRGQCQ